MSDDDWGILADKLFEEMEEQRRKLEPPIKEKSGSYWDKCECGADFLQFPRHDRDCPKWKPKPYQT